MSASLDLASGSYGLDGATDENLVVLCRAASGGTPIVTGANDHSDFGSVVGGVYPLGLELELVEIGSPDRQRVGARRAIRFVNNSLLECRRERRTVR